MLWYGSRSFKLSCFIKYCIYYEYKILQMNYMNYVSIFVAEKHSVIVVTTYLIFMVILL